MPEDMAAFGTKLHRAPAAMRKATNLAGDAAAKLVRKSVLSQLDRVAPRRTVKGRKGKPAKLDARIQVGRGTGTVDVQAAVFAKGPWHLVERDTRAHDEPLHARGRRHKQLAMPGIGVRNRVHHPGTHGRHPFSKGVDAVQPDLRRAVAVEYDKGLRVVLK